MKLRVGMPLVTKNAQRYTNAVVYKLFEGEHRTAVHVLTGYGNLRIFPSVEDVLCDYVVSNSYLETLDMMNEYGMGQKWLDGQFNIRDRLQNQITLLTKALEEIDK